MDITKQQIDKDSEQDFINKLSVYVDSGAGIIHIRTGEVFRTLSAIRKQGILDDGIVKEWDILNGFRQYTEDNISDMVGVGDGNVDISSAFCAPLEQLRGEGVNKTTYYVYVNPHVFMENNPFMLHLLLLYNHILPSINIVVLLVTPDIPLPTTGEENLLSITFSTPGITELRKSLDFILHGAEYDFSEGVGISDEEANKVCYVGAGLSKNLFETYTSLSIVEAARKGQNAITGPDIATGVSIGKTDIVNSNDILELYPSEDMKHVGGLENLKGWVARRSKCYSEDAKEYGIEPPKGIVLVGVPGSGKSLVAKAISSELGVPLVRLDFGRVFNSLIGASEQRIRTALKMVESMAPICLFCDEVDKGLGGIGGSGDSGTSSRVLGSFLTWLNDCKAPVFTIVTANNVTGLPPEMLRRGRFDAIFSTSMPTARERREVLKIHLEKRGRDLSEFPKKEVDNIVEVSEGYVPAEIESAVKDALVDAFNEGKSVSMGHIKAALHAMVPLSRAFGPQIQAMNEWARANATPAGLDTPETVAESTSIRLPTRRIMNRTNRGGSLQ